ETPIPQAEQPTQPPAPAAAVTVSPENAIRVYYIYKEEKGQFGCGEAIRYVLTKQARSSSLAGDIRYAISVMLTLHEPNFGQLYHGGYAANLAVADVTVNADGSIKVALSGEWKANDRCDGKRFIDQLRQTIRQFGPSPLIQITINGTPIADAVSRK
ncbi:MAG: hypothetical protein ACKOC5_11275, partial [Chloroflexota bacterium]